MPATPAFAPRPLLVMIALLGVCGTIACAAADPAEPAAEQAPALRVVCFGDSLTGHRPGEDYQAHYLKYADLLGLMLEARVGVGRVAMHNAGWAGDRTTPKPSEGWPGAAGRVAEDILDHDPDIVTILIGGNDNPQTDEARATTRANIESIVKQCKDAGIKVLLLQYPPALPAPEHEAEAWHHLDDVNPLIAAVAKAQGVPLLHLGPAMQAAAKKHGNAHVANAKDGVHLAPGGELVFARAIFAKLDELGWVGAADAEAGAAD